MLQLCLLREVSTVVGRSNITIQGKGGDSCVFYDSVLYEKKWARGGRREKEKRGFLLS